METSPRGKIGYDAANNPIMKKPHVTETYTRVYIGGDSNEAHQAAGLMTDDSQTREGAGAPTVDLLKPKQKMRVGCWNVQTLYQTGRMPQLVKEFDNYNLDILGVSEVRWTGTGKRRLASGHTIVFSGRSDNQHSEGVALLLNRKTEKALLEWKPFGSRLLKARFHSKYTKLSVLVCYAPTEDANAEVKDAF